MPSPPVMNSRAACAPTTPSPAGEPTSTGSPARPGTTSRRSARADPTRAVCASTTPSHAGAEGDPVVSPGDLCPVSWTRFVGVRRRVVVVGGRWDAGEHLRFGSVREAFGSNMQDLWRGAAGSGLDGAARWGCEGCSVRAFGAICVPHVCTKEPTPAKRGARPPLWRAQVGRRGRVNASERRG